MEFADWKKKKTYLGIGNVFRKGEIEETKVRKEYRSKGSSIFSSYFLP